MSRRALTEMAVGLVWLVGLVVPAAILGGFIYWFAVQIWNEQRVMSEPAPFMYDLVLSFFLICGGFAVVLSSIGLVALGVHAVGKSIREALRTEE